MYGTILPQIFNRKLGVPVRKEQKMKKAFLLKKNFSVLNVPYIKTIKKEILKTRIWLRHYRRNFKDFLSTFVIVSGLPEKINSLPLQNNCIKTVRKKCDLVVKAEGWIVGLQSLDLCSIIILPYGPGQVQSISEGPDLLQVCFGLKNTERLWRSHSGNLNNICLANRKKPEMMMTCIEWAYTKPVDVGESNHFQKSLQGCFEVLR